MSSRNLKTFGSVWTFRRLYFIIFMKRNTNWCKMIFFFYHSGDLLEVIVSGNKVIGRWPPPRTTMSRNYSWHTGGDHRSTSACDDSAHQNQQKQR